MSSKFTRLTISILLILVTGWLTVRPASAMPSAMPPHCRVLANAGWIDCHIDVVAGVRTTIAATGRTVTTNLHDYPDAHSGPNGQITNCSNFDGSSLCALDGKPYGALIGKISPTGTPFMIGSRSSFVPEASGHLYVAVNDNLPDYTDNHGSYWVYWVYTP